MTDMSTSIALHGGRHDLLEKREGHEADARKAETASPGATIVSEAPPAPAAVAARKAEDEITRVSEEDWDAAAISGSTPILRRFELPIQLAAGLLPAVAIWLLQDRRLFEGAFSETLLVLGVASFLSWYVLARLRDHAKARHLSYVLPINCLIFSAAIAVAALLRLPYSASLFAVGASNTLLVSFLLAVRNRGLMKPHVIVPGGRTSEICITGQYLPAPSASDLRELVRSGRRDWAIVADLHYYHSPGWERLFAEAALAGIPVYHFRQIAEMQTGQVKITHLSENDLGSLIPNVSYMSVKRLIDVLGAIALLPFCLVAFAFIALVIRLDSPGSPFFIQERVGFRGQRFQMIKFRTMRQRAPAAEAAAQREDAMTQSDDHRITRVGRFLRKTRIDELPQIINVLKGDMSFIGPRPEAKALSEWYEEELPFYSYRHIVRPGITGWAQVNQGHVTQVTDVLPKLRYDFYYIRNISLWLDLLVALKTVRVIATGLGAK